jgi:hypothetical protein
MVRGVVLAESLLVRAGDEYDGKENACNKEPVLLMITAARPD